MTKRAKSGDIFAGKLGNGQFMFGRVLLDIKEQCFKPKLAEKGVSNLRHMSSGYLVEVYDAISDQAVVPSTLNVVINGIGVDDMAMDDGNWEIVGNAPVDPAMIDFQEHISYYNGEVSLYRGELVLEGKLNDDRLLSLPQYGYLRSINLFELALDVIGKPELATRELSIHKYDARFDQSGLRELVYKALGEDMNDSYVNLAQKHGFDTSRFFNQKKKEAKPKSKPELKHLMKGVSWTFDGTQFENLHAFEKAVGDESWKDRKVALSEMEILLEFVDENDEDQEIQFVLSADNGKHFTEAELLFKINEQVTQRLAGLDKHFFEGLSLLKNVQPPLYSLDLGS